MNAQDITLEIELEAYRELKAEWSGKDDLLVSAIDTRIDALQERLAQERLTALLIEHLDIEFPQEVDVDMEELIAQANAEVTNE